jgi:hypothetical protein
MVASVQSPADLVNVSLRRIGYKLRIGNLYEGSEASKISLDLYAQTRDELLRQNDFDFAERNLNMTLLKQAPVGGYIPPNTWSPVYPSLPWLFSYVYPSDCLKVRAIRGQAIFVMDFDPQPIVFMVENDNSYTPAKKVILCNVPSGILTYTGQITDLTTWEADSVEMFAAALGRRLAPALVGLNNAKLAAEDEAQAMAVAEKEQG